MPDLNPNKRMRVSSLSGAAASSGSGDPAAVVVTPNNNAVVASTSRPAFAVNILDNPDLYSGIKLSSDCSKWVCERCTPRPTSRDWSLTHGKSSNIQQHLKTESHRSKTNTTSNQPQLPLAWRARVSQVSQTDLNNLFFQVFSSFFFDFF